MFPVDCEFFLILCSETLEVRDLNELVRSRWDTKPPTFEIEEFSTMKSACSLERSIWDGQSE